MSAFDRAAPDGSPVELYARLGPMGEPELIHAAVPAGSAILELGSGAGRLTHPLLALGHPVVAVDESAEMLQRVEGAETVQADMRSLSLRRRFPVVVLASHFVNDVDAETRRAFLRCCSRHVEPTGQVLLERLPPDWKPTSDWIELGAVRARLHEFVQEGPVVRGEMEYVVDGRRLVHAFASRILGDDELAEELGRCGLRFARTLDERGTWVEALPTST